MKNPIISVIMSNYNTPIDYLKQSVESILKQTLKEFEFIIIDDGSTDTSFKYLSSLTDPRIVLVRNKENIGLTKSLNIGLKIAKGTFIARMDSDDIAIEDRFEKQIKFMEENPDVIVSGTWAKRFGERVEILKPSIQNFEDYKCQLLFNNKPITLIHPTAIFRSEMIEKYGIIYDETLKQAQDYQMWVNCSRYGRIAILEEILLYYRTHKLQISSMQYSAQKKCATEISRRQLEQLNVSVRKFKTFYWKDVNEMYNYYMQIINNNNYFNILNKTALHEFLIDKNFRAFSRLNVLDKIKVLIFCCFSQKKEYAKIIYSKLFNLHNRIEENE